MDRQTDGWTDKDIFAPKKVGWAMLHYWKEVIKQHNIVHQTVAVRLSSGMGASSSNIIESVDSISKDERGFPLTQYITNGRISRGGYTFTHFKHHHHVLRLISYSMSV